MNNTIFKIFLISFLSVVLFCLSRSGIRQYTAADSQLTLLTSQSILEHGTTNLYDYYSSMDPQEFSDGTWKYSVWEKERKVYYFYPIGTSIISIPIVGIARLMGYDLANKHDDALWQSIIASMSVSIIFVLFVLFACNFVSFPVSLVFSFLFCLGTSISSTVGLALWSFNFEIIFLLLGLIHLVKKQDKPSDLNGYKLGFFFYLAWLCRPTALLLLPIMVFWLFRNNKRALRYFLICFLLLLVPFVIYSLIYFNKFLLPYYDPFFWNSSKIEEHSFFYKYFASLFSPARGLILFSPLLLLPLFSFFSSKVRGDVFFKISAVWFLLHSIMVANQWCWWGGWCFGPRLYTDALIPLFIISVILLRVIMLSRQKYLLILLIVLISIPGIFIHAYKGVRDIHTFKWNDEPAIDEHIDYYAWNFEYPQFLADSISNSSKKNELLIWKDLDYHIRNLKSTDVIYLPVADTLVVSKIRLNKKYSMMNLYFNKQELFDLKKDTFYSPTRFYNELISDSALELEKPVNRSLGSYLNAHKNDHVFLFTKFEILKNMSGETHLYFRSIQSKFYNIYFKRGVFMHIYKGNLINERIIQKDPIEYSKVISGHSVVAFSDGNRYNSIKLDGKEFCYNEDGFNLVCINEQGEIVNVSRFNTHIIDTEYIYLLKAYLKSNNLK